MLNKILRFIVYRLRRILFPAVAWKYTYPRDRGTPPQVHTDELRREYEHGPLAGEPDTFVLYRIIGNDLVPRHKKGQSRENLRFILENEPELEACEKRWVVNRIVDREEEKASLELLKEHDQRYIHFPFDWDEYAKVPWDLDGAPYPGFSYSLAHDFMPEPVQARYLTRLYRHKNNYVMHNNGARNAALREGRTLAKWILPWDGNCFVTAQAWDEIRSQVTTSPWYPYFIVPMARLTDNAELLDPEFRPEARDEPQILFRRDAEEEFNEEHPYGRRPKVELFWRLGVPGKWDRWGLEPWDLPCPEYAREAGRFSYAGWVARMFSGQSRMETPGKGAYRQRHLARVEGITGFLERLDVQRLEQQYDPSALTAYSAEALEWHKTNYCQQPDSSSAVPVKILLETANTLSVSGQADDTKYIGQQPLNSVRRIMLSSLAWYFSSNTRYFNYGVELIRNNFLNSESTDFPALAKLRSAQSEQPWHNATDNTSLWFDMYLFSDAIRLLNLDRTEADGIVQWLRRYVDRLLMSQPGKQQKRCRDHRGTFYDLGLASIAAFLGDSRLLLDTLRISQERLLQQFDEDGRQPQELRLDEPEGACLFNLFGWVHMTRLAEHCGMDLGRFPSDVDSAIEQGITWARNNLASSSTETGGMMEVMDLPTFLSLYHNREAENGGFLLSECIICEIAADTHIDKPGIKPFWIFDIIQDDL